MITLFLYCAVFIFCYMSCVFSVAILKKDNSIVDIAWGLGFVALALFCCFYTQRFVARSLVVTLLIAIWGVRLSFHILLRHWGKSEDFRYVQLRATWGKHPLLNAYFKVFMLQGLMMLLIGYPIILVYANSPSGVDFSLLFGVLLWALGFVFEAVGDYQLQQFVARPANKGRVMDQGLWAYTRHPNYFGEIAMWWGIFVIVLSVPFGLSAIISPLIITYLLLRVSGIPLLEKQFDANPAYQEYKKRTNMLIPWFRRMA